MHRSGGLLLENIQILQGASICFSLKDTTNLLETSVVKPPIQNRSGLIKPLSFQGGEELDGVVGVLLFQDLPGLLQRTGGSTMLEFVGLGQKDMHRHLGLLAPIEHQAVELLERMADIHHQDQAVQALSLLQVTVKGLLPVAFNLFGNLGVTVAGEVDQTSLVIQFKQVDHLGAARGFAGAGQALDITNDIESARFAGVGAPGKGDLNTLVCRQLIQPVGADQKLGLAVAIDDGVVVVG